MRLISFYVILIHIYVNQRWTFVTKWCWQKDVDIFHRRMKNILKIYLKKISEKFINFIGYRKEKNLSILYYIIFLYYVYHILHIIISACICVKNFNQDDDVTIFYCNLSRVLQAELGRQEFPSETTDSSVI